VIVWITRAFVVACNDNGNGASMNQSQINSAMAHFKINPKDIQRDDEDGFRSADCKTVIKSLVNKSRLVVELSFHHRERYSSVEYFFILKVTLKGGEHGFEKEIISCDERRQVFSLGTVELIAIKDEIFGEMDVMTVALLIFKSVRNLNLIKLACCTVWRAIASKPGLCAVRFVEQGGLVGEADDEGGQAVQAKGQEGEEQVGKKEMIFSQPFLFRD
jgi:hypothetical protein